MYLKSSVCQTKKVGLIPKDFTIVYSNCSLKKIILYCQYFQFSANSFFIKLAITTTKTSFIETSNVAEPLSRDYKAVCWVKFYQFFIYNSYCLNAKMASILMVFQFIVFQFFVFIWKYYVFVRLPKSVFFYYSLDEFSLVWVWVLIFISKNKVRQTKQVCMIWKFIAVST